MDEYVRRPDREVPGDLRGGLATFHFRFAARLRLAFRIEFRREFRLALFFCTFTLGCSHRFLLIW